MDRATKVARCARFIGEFGDAYRAKFGFSIGRRMVVVREMLGYDDHDECVRFQVTLQPEGCEEEIRLMLEPVLFAPEEDVKDQMAQVFDDLEMEADAVRRRFGTAGISGRRR